MLSQYKTVYRGDEAEIIEKKSRFIATVQPIKSEEEAITFIEAMKKKYWNAKHNCFAYVLGEHFQIQRCSDDGEPSGTAGKPMLDVLLGEEIHDVVVVVTRYFGGTLLGTGGLVRAYSHSAVIAIDGAEVVTYEPYYEYELICGYSEYQKYSNILSIERAVIDSTDFGAEVLVRFAVKKTRSERILTKISEAGFGRDVPKFLGERFDCR